MVSTEPPTNKSQKIINRVDTIDTSHASISYSEPAWGHNGQWGDNGQWGVNGWGKAWGHLAKLETVGGRERLQDESGYGICVAVMFQQWELGVVLPRLP